MKPLHRVLLALNCTWLMLATLLLVGLTFYFPENCSVTNKTSQTIFVTPVGALGNVTSRSLLPLHHTFFPHLAQTKRGGFEIRPGETFHFSYDMDDISYKELAVESDGKMVGQHTINSVSPNGPNTRPPDWDLVIDDLSKLQPISPSVALAAAEAKKSSRIWVLYVLIILPWISTGFLGIYEWRKKRAAQNQYTF
jgi:hypothetical protein